MKRILLISALILVFIGLGIAGWQLYTQSQPTYAKLTEEQVISYIQVYGLTGMVDGYIVPVGVWAAVEESPGRWKVRGEVSLGGSRRYSCTWIFDNGTIISPRLPDYTIPRFQDLNLGIV